MSFWPKKEIIEGLRKVYLKGTRVKLQYMNDTQAPPIGTLGTVEHVDDAGTIHVNWDNGSGLGVILGEDKVEIVKWVE